MTLVRALAARPPDADGTDLIGIMHCRRRSRRICRVCSLSPVEPPRPVCPTCLAWLAGRFRLPAAETMADLPGMAEILRRLEAPAADEPRADLAHIRAVLSGQAPAPARRPERLINGVPERLIPSAELPLDPRAPQGSVPPDELLEAIAAEPGVGRAALADTFEVGRDAIGKRAAALVAEYRIRAEYRSGNGGWRYWPAEAAP